MFIDHVNILVLLPFSLIRCTYIVRPNGWSKQMLFPLNNQGIYCRTKWVIETNVTSIEQSRMQLLVQISKCGYNSSFSLRSRWVQVKYTYLYVFKLRVVVNYTFLLYHVIKFRRMYYCAFYYAIDIIDKENVRCLLETRNSLDSYLILLLYKDVVGLYQ